MSFWTSFAKHVILRVFSDGDNARGPERSEERPCRQCGRMTPVEALWEGRCIRCRLEQEQQQDRQNHQKRQYESRGARASGNNSQGIDEAYRILGCQASDSDDEIKKKFRVLIKECHVDSLPKDLPDYLVKAANKRFNEVQEAYDLIRQVRKIT
jgi:hypothetical protein